VRRWRHLILVLLAALIACAVTFFKKLPTVDGTVVVVHDGDTLTVAHNGGKEKVRLQGVDCPELAQQYGRQAKQFTTRLCLGKAVTVKVVTKDQYGRSVGYVTLPDGKSLNQELVRNGMAWWYEQYARGDRTLEGLQEEARKERRGLWAEKDPVAPWTYRRNNGY